jgi:hypothetical protein
MAFGGNVFESGEGGEGKEGPEGKEGKEGKVEPPEAVRVVGAEGQPAFEHGAKNIGGGNQVIGFWKAGGIVYLQGIGDLPTGTASAFTLPAGYRPSAVEHFPVLLGSTVKDVYIETDGKVQVFEGGAEATSLSGLTFRAA